MRAGRGTRPRDRSRISSWTMLHAFVLIVLAMLLGDVAWWLWADRLLRRTRRPKLWRPLLGLFTGLLLGYLVFFLVFPEQGRHAHLWVPMPVLAGIYLWHLLVLPGTLIGIIVWVAVAATRAWWKRGRRRRSAVIEEPTDLVP